MNTLIMYKAKQDEVANEVKEKGRKKSKICIGDDASQTVTCFLWATTSSATPLEKCKRHEEEDERGSNGCRHGCSFSFQKCHVIKNNFELIN